MRGRVQVSISCGLTLGGADSAPGALLARADLAMIPLLHEVLKTPSNKIELAPLHITADVGRLTSRVDAANDPENTLVTGLVLTSRRHLRSKNSWMHNINVLVKGKDRCTLLIHPSDAEAAPSPQAVSGAAYGHSL